LHLQYQFFFSGVSIGGICIASSMIWLSAGFPGSPRPAKRNFRPDGASRNFACFLTNNSSVKYYGFDTSGRRAVTDEFHRLCAPARGIFQIHFRQDGSITTAHTKRLVLLLRPQRAIVAENQ
jgi:hypothetical protein